MGQFIKSSQRVRTRSNMVLSFLCALAALVVAFWDQTCNPLMSTWLMVYGLYVPVIILAFILVVCCLPCMAVLVVPLCLLIIALPILIIGIVIFPVVWWIYGCVIFWPQVASSPCSLLAVTGTLITILMPLSACMEGVFAKRYEIRLEWEKEEGVVYFKSRGRRRPIFATNNKTQNQNQNQNQTQIHTVSSAV